MFMRSLSLFSVPALLVLLLCASAPAAADVHVDDSNTSGTENGSVLRPYNTIQEALDAAVTGDRVLVAAGTYAENVVIDTKQIDLRGGYVGAAPSAYAGGTGGNFSTQNPTANVTRIDGDIAEATVLLVFTESSGSTVDGFTITGGRHGIRLDILLTFPHISNATISNNILEDNGVGEYEHRGGGLAGYGDDLLVRDNIFRNNIGGRGAGMHVEGTNIRVEDNLVEGNIGYNDHGGGVSLSGDTSFSGNLVRNNRTGEGLGYGWAGGVLIIGEAVLTGNTYTGNHAPSIGGGVFVDEGGTMVMENDLVYGNTADLGAGVYVDGEGGGGKGSVGTIRFCTIVNNTSPIDPVGNAVYVEQDSDATVTNTIAWGNDGDDFYVADDSSLTVTYTLSQEAWAGTGNFSADPLFANAANNDYHLRSSAGRFDPAANSGAGGWVLDAADSPAIDAANPAAPFANEPAPNGGRANLGAYGNTAEASKSDGVAEGAVDGEGTPEGTPEGTLEGVTEGEGISEGEGVVEGEGMPEGSIEGEGAAEGEGTLEGEDPYREIQRQLLFTFASAETSGDGLLTLAEILFQLPSFTQEALDDADANNDNRLSVAELLDATGGGIIMNTDINADFVVQLSELLRLIQFYNASRYYCANNPGASEDGFVVSPPGAEPTCLPHSADLDDSKVISLSELLRAIQFYNLGGYSYCMEQSPEDGFCG
jgi:hypothetical protein